MQQKITACIISYLGEKDRQRRLDGHIKQLEWLDEMQIPSVALYQEYTPEELDRVNAFKFHTYITFSNKMKAPKARNVLMEKYYSQSEWLMMMDDDSILENFQISDLDKVTGSDVITPLFVKVDKHTEEDYKPFMEAGKRLKGSVIFLRSKTCQEKGLWFDDKVAYWDDNDFGFRAILMGLKYHKCWMWNLIEFDLDVTSVIFEVLGYEGEDMVKVRLEQDERIVDEMCQVYGKYLTKIGPRRIDYTKLYVATGLQDYWIK